MSVLGVSGSDTTLASNVTVTLPFPGISSIVNWVLGSAPAFAWPLILKVLGTYSRPAGNLSTKVALLKVLAEVLFNTTV